MSLDGFIAPDPSDLMGQQWMELQRDLPAGFFRENLSSARAARKA